MWQSIMFIMVLERWALLSADSFPEGQRFDHLFLTDYIVGHKTHYGVVPVLGDLFGKDDEGGFLQWVVHHSEIHFYI